MYTKAYCARTLAERSNESNRTTNFAWCCNDTVVRQKNIKKKKIIKTLREEGKKAIRSNASYKL